MLSTSHDNMRQIIALTGYSGSGKDTAASYLIEQYGFQKMSFAATLKDAISVIFGWPRDMLEGLTNVSREWRDKKDVWWSERLDMYVTPRKILQLWGTEVCRQHFHEDIWIMSLERQLSQLPETAKIVITDCRFENEAAMIRSMGGIVIHIRRWITAPGLRTNTNSRNHKSESGIEVNDSDMIISNNGTLQELHENVYNILSK